MESLTSLSPGELNAAALDVFVDKQVDQRMIKYIAEAAFNVIQCDSTIMPPPTADASWPRLPSPPHTPPLTAVRSEDGGLPSLQEFITKLVVSSNMQVPTLISTQPMAKGLRCTTHRIFLASLILAAKYLNDSSPMNKHWANYSNIHTQAYNFGFTRTDVNLMEKQLLHLLDWDLRISEEDLYREFDHFLAPIRNDIEAHHARRARARSRRDASANSRRGPGLPWPEPPRRARTPRRHHRGALIAPAMPALPAQAPFRDISPPGSNTSRATTPDDLDSKIPLYHGVLYESPVQFDRQ
ncbi:hypothetical protein B0H63DRAFT_498212 [Podospora didyma]|uniref:Cyclin N-terminal domain-containing protein n=1 Tax=Podospora didyma TaxID=330526 RepID=A0AAE0JYA6_9PEZI|nr:hypothetical protein B0H63DRAFT_498212 [Podospora didyma]